MDDALPICRSGVHIDFLKYEIEIIAQPNSGVIGRNECINRGREHGKCHIGFNFSWLLSLWSSFLLGHTYEKDTYVFLHMLPAKDMPYF